MTERPEPGNRSGAPEQRGDGPALNRNSLTASGQFQRAGQRFVLKDFARSLASRCHYVPPDERCTVIKLHTCALFETSAGEGNQLVGQILQVGALPYGDNRALRRRSVLGPAAVKAGRTGGGDLSLSARGEIDAAFERIPIQDPAGHVVQMGERLPGWRLESPYDFPRRLLPFHPQNRGTVPARFER